jgi:glycosyltransferase involved in cell wall biosynthesis
LHLIQELVATNQCDVYAFYNDRTVESSLDTCRAVYVSGKNRLLWDYVSFPVAARRYPIDCIIYPVMTIPVSHVALLATRRVNVVHDLAYFDAELNAYPFLDTVYHRTLLGISCRIADRTIADSASTKCDLQNIVGLDDESISIIHLGIDDGFRPLEPSAANNIVSNLGFRKPYLFYCGTLSPRKNILRLLQALKSLEPDIPHCLYLAGGISWNDEEVRDYWKRELPTRVAHIGHLTELQLRAAYSAADLFVYPSLFEGFGLPILEAQACGCPVLTSTLKSCPEVAGSGAHFVDAYSVQSIAEGIVEVITRPEYRSQLIERGFSNVAQYSWKRCADEYLEMLLAKVCI